MIFQNLAKQKRKSAGRVVSFSEATSTILNRSAQKPSEADSLVDEEEATEPYQDVKGKLRTLTIDVKQLKNSEKMTLKYEISAIIIFSKYNF